MLNKVQLIGNLGADPDIRITAGGKQVAEVRLATSYGTGDKKETEWHRLIVWDKLADVVAKYTKKGSRIFVEGRIKSRSYDDKDGNKRYITEIVVNEMKLLDSRDAAPAPADTGQSGADDLPF